TTGRAEPVGKGTDPADDAIGLRLAHAGHEAMVRVLGTVDIFTAVLLLAQAVFDQGFGHLAQWKLSAGVQGFPGFLGFFLIGLEAVMGATGPMIGPLGVSP